jgi:heavy metal sensor kinase
MILNSIRWRLQIWHSLILVLVLAGFGLTAYQVARDNQLRRIDEELGKRFAAVFRRGPPPQPRWEKDNPGDLKGGRPEHEPPPPGEPKGGRPEREPPPDDRHRDPAFWQQRIRSLIEQSDAVEGSQTNTFYYVMWHQDGSLLAQSPSAPAEVPRPVFAKQTSPERDSRQPPVSRTRGDLRELAVLLPMGDCLLVGRSMAPDLAAMRRLALWLFTAGAGVLALGLAGGWWLASRAIRPIEDISATAVKIAAGDLSQRISTTETESELGRLTTVLNSTFARLEAAFNHQVRFTADASHELRTPVTVILTQTQSALARERSSEEYRETLAACRRAAQRMRTLTESLLQLARIDAGEDMMKHERLDLSQVVRESLELIRPLAAERQLQIHSALPTVACHGDPERLGQVVVNLLTNAVHYNREQGEIRVSVSVENGSALVKVTDTGEGIPAEDIPHIGERFYRVDKSRSRQQGHTGLGLAICRAIIEAHSGALEVCSQVNVGSTFTVRLPAS